MRAALESNIWKYTLFLVTNKRVFAAIVGAYYLTVPGVTPFWIGVFLLAGNAATFFFDIPSSYIADKIGHKEALALSRVSMIISSLAFIFAGNIYWLIVASVFLSIGFAFVSGVGNVFMHETLRALGRESEYRTVMGRVSSIGFFIPAVMAVAIPFLVSISYTIPFAIGLGLDVLGLVVALSFVRPAVPLERVAEQIDANIVEVIRQGRALRFFRIAIFSGLISAIMFGFDGFRAPYQVFLGVPVIWFGVFFGTGRMLAALMLAYSGKLHKLIGDVYSYQRIQIIVYGILLLVAGIVADPWVVVTVFIIDNALKWGTSQVDTGYLLDIIRENRFKATLLSMSNQLENLFNMIVVGVVGFSISIFGYQPSFLGLAGVFFLVMVPAYFYTTHARVVYATK